MRIEAEKLRVDDPSQMLTTARRQGIRQHYAALLVLVERLEEKSALLEYDEGYLRHEAERVAWALLCHAAETTAYRAPRQRWYEGLQLKKQPFSP